MDRPALDEPVDYLVDPALRRDIPWIPAFLPASPAQRGAPVLQAASIAGARPGSLLVAPSFWRPPPLGGREKPVGLLLMAAEAVARAASNPAERDPLLVAALSAAALPWPGPGPAALTPLLALMEEGRIGGATGLDDPGAAGLGLPHRAAVVVIDPCLPGRAAAARALFDHALAEARQEGMDTLVIRSPNAPTGATPCLPETPGLRRLDQPLAPWTIVDLAARLHALEEEAALLALAAGVPVRGTLPGGLAAGHAGPEPHPALARLFAATRWADPFRRAACTPEEGLTLLGLWRAASARNRRVAVCLGMQFWKQERMAALFASDRPAPRFRRKANAALDLARRATRGGAPPPIALGSRPGMSPRRVAIAAWATRMPAGFAERARLNGVETLFVEDGFIRSVGLGAGFLPGASYALDWRGPYYDPRMATDLEHLLAGTRFDQPLLDRARALREAVVAMGISKYNLNGTPPRLSIPAGRRAVLVPGQVENDASVRWGGGAIQGNLALLRAVRGARPEAWIVYKPHPDVTAGYRPGRLSATDLAGLADEILPDAPIIPLIGMVDEVHTLTSQTGFEALLRERPVVTYGQPFYAGWGLSQDLEPPRRRQRRLTLDELVAGCLILYPCYLDPVTELPCSPEWLIERLADPGAWRTGRAARLRRLQGAVQAFIGRIAGRR